MTEPTTDELRSAYRETGLAFQGIDFAKAMQVRLFRMCLRGMAICQRRQAERNGNRAPDQPALI